MALMKKLLIAGIALLLMLATIASVWACPGPTTEVPDSILIGDVVSYTGIYSAFGGLSSFGAKAAVEDINKEGGIYVEDYGTKIPVEWVTVDCQSDPLKVSTLTEDLILRQNVDFLGGGCEVPPLREATAIMADKYKIPAVFGANPFELWQAMKASSDSNWDYSWVLGIRLGAPFPEGDVRAADPNGYLVMPTYLAAQEAYADQTNRKVAVFAMDDADGRPWYLAFTEMSNAAGYDCYGSDQQFGIYPPGTTDFTSLIQEWKNAGCEILWGSAPAPDIGTILKQCKAQGFEPKIVFAVRGAMFYQEIASWGGDLPLGVCSEVYWSPTMVNTKGIGDTTPQSLTDRWYEYSGNEPVPQGIGWGYAIMQTLFDGIERAGTLDHEAVNEAMASTDLLTLWGRVVFVEPEHHTSAPVAFSQWQKTDSPSVWDNPVIYSQSDSFPVAGQIIFPKPWD
jgi:branched-chain amino acid transport system substrate-binding protein